MKDTPSVALVYDRVNTPYGGAEIVLLALHEAFPKAPLFTAVYNRKRAKWADVLKVTPSWLQHIPGASTHHRWLAPLMPVAFESFNFDGYDVIISVTSAEAKGVLTKPEQLHMCYNLTPTRYLHSHRKEYEQTHRPFTIPIISSVSRKLLDYLSWWDTAAAQRPDIYIPISKLVGKRIETYYHRKPSSVIYPPLPKPESEADVAQYKPDYLPEDYLVVISRLVPYKKVAVAVQAAQRANKPLVVIGEGPELANLQKIAGNQVYFLGSVEFLQRQAVLKHAQALLMLGIEDFGITALEAAQLKIPVILHEQSGAAELLEHTKTSLHLKDDSIESVVAAIHNLSSTKFEFSQFQKNMQKYAITKFVETFRTTVQDEWQKHQERML